MAKANDYIKLKAEKSKYCKGKTTKTAVVKAALKYVKSTVAKGNKTKAEAEKAAQKVLASSCAVKAPAKKAASRGRVKVKEHDKAYPVKSRDTEGLHSLLKEKKLRLKHGYETTKVVRTIAGLKQELKKNGYVEVVNVKHIAKK
jgi:hypothetical protein